MRKMLPAMAMVAFLLLSAGGATAQTPTPTPEGIMGIQLAIPELEAYDYDSDQATPLDGVELGFGEIWAAVRAGYTLYDIVSSIDVWPVLAGLLLISTAIGVLARVILHPPDL